MTNQSDLNKDFVSMFRDLVDDIHKIKMTMIDLKGSIDSQHIRNDNFNDRLINLEENKIKVIDEELKRIDTLEQAFNREL
jgi:hypothetical protein|tara:strand:+ start:121 stop:360 length:240 start_codon:yes stop_codon:yes gene_type:complete